MKITEEMMDEALQAFDDTYDVETFPTGNSDNKRAALKAAVEAALRALPVSPIEAAAIRIDQRYVLDGESPLDRFERIAALFQKDTGFMAPGKDCPAAGYAGDERERERQAAWMTWSDAPYKELRAAIAQQSDKRGGA